MADSLTDGLKRAAPQWSLAGDKQLLDVLQGLHQKIIEKCQETNRNLEKMVTALDEASIHLQNVNNKFTALSNSQFIESRVFDDDGEDLPAPEKPKEQEQPDEETELDKIRRGLQVLERMHESVTILCDSDSESGTDDDDVTRVVLKPKDVYADRPLPYIIGSKAWKAKWHAGLLPDESDSDSASVKETANKEEYSDSDPEPISDSPRRYAHAHARRSPTISSSSDIESEAEPRPAPPAPPGPSQSAVAAELARRLGGNHQLPQTQPEDSPPSPAVRKTYKPHQPTPGNVFLDEPPPIDSDQSEDDDDIFAEINKKQPYRQSSKVDTSVADDLFGRPVFDVVPPPNPPAIQKQSLFEDESEPELFVSEKPPPEQRKEQDIITVKKPVGGMSLFGSNANAESIGAAILKRNQRHSSNSEEESEQEPLQTETKKKPVEEPNKKDLLKEREVKTQKEKERDIFEDLFAKSERINKEKNKASIKEDRKEKEVFKKLEKKPDLFSDNIFDDIDDIFTNDVKIISKNDKKQQKSIFDDDDDDDLFAEVSEKVKQEKVNKNGSQSTKDIFAKDNIFNEEPPEIPPTEVKSIKETKSIFDDSDDDLFSDVDKTNRNVTKSVNVPESKIASNVASGSVKTENVEKGLFSDDDNLFIDANKSVPTIKEQKINKKSSETLSKENKNEKETTKQPSKVILSPDIFDEEDDGLFLFAPTQSNTKANQETEKRTQNRSDISENKLPEIIKRENSNPSINTNIMKEDVISKSTKSIFSDGDSQDDIFSKPLSTNKQNENVIKDTKTVSENKTIEVKVINTDNNDINIINKTDQTIVKTTISVNKPNLSEKPVIKDVTVINTKITVAPSDEFDNTACQDAVSTDATVIENKITVIPEISPVSSPDVANDEKVLIEPVISQKPIIAKKPIQSEVLSQEKDTEDMKKGGHAKKLTNKTEKKTVDPPPDTDTKTDLFEDIFNDLPPVFEKPKEPKKSKNVNALFEDDSDDETLFFKKNDTITDERPEGFISSDDKLFGLFMDEPPALDVDFVQKSNKSDKLPNIVEKSSQKDTIVNKNTAINTDIEDIIFNDDGFSFGNETTKNENNNLNTDSKPKDLFSNITDNIFKKTSIEEEDDDLFKIHKVDDNISTNKTEKKLPKQTDSENVITKDDVTTETKKVGKLKPMNFNINVSTLLPGASPKKVVKSSDNTDGQITSRSNDEIFSDTEIKNTEIEPILVKSVSFDGNPDSSVLDNKFSKERAKIQVKRRPSTRRARREAVKKSGIDFGEDSTDNSSSIDDQSKISKETSDYQHAGTNNETIDFEDSFTSENDKKILNIEQDLVVKTASVKDNRALQDIKSDDAFRENKISSESQTKSIFDSDDDVGSLEFVKEDSKRDENPNKSINATTNVKDVKSKVVYILNDEDIFSTKAEDKSEESKTISDDKLPENVVSDRKDPFESITKNETKLFEKEGITTLGKVYDSKPKTLKLDLLSDSDDENLFKSSTISKQIKPTENKPDTATSSKVEVKNVTLKSKTKKSIFDDADDDLFKGKTVEKSKKQSLFGSDSDEELFSGAKKVKEVPQKKENKKEDIRKQVKKASLFEDDDDDLFGVKKKNEESKPQPVVTKKKEEITNIQPEPVFADPLSLLGYDDE